MSAHNDVSEILHRSANSLGGESQPGSTSPETSKRKISKAKRRDLVVAACQSCRQKKLKCDALRPCAQCAKRGWLCTYETQEGETHSQASKRKFDEISRSNQSYVDLYNMIMSRSEREAVEIVQLIRSGQSPETIVQTMQAGNPAIFLSDPRRLAHKTFLITLAHSSGSLRDVTRFATSTLHPRSNVRLPGSEDYDIFRNRIVHLPLVEALVHDTERAISGVSGGQHSSPGRVMSATSWPSTNVPTEVTNATDISNDLYPLHRVPAAPWTSITASDEAISHLVSIFLAWFNPTWRFVEEDLFLLGMRSQRLRSEFCSPLLVNCICAIASLQSEHNIAFVDGTRDRITRGLQFHDEALRLWALEEYRPSLTNVQSMSILGLESNYRAKDKLGLSLAPISVQLDNQIPVKLDARRPSFHGVAERDVMRARLSAHWTSKSAYIIMLIAFMSDRIVDVKVTDLPTINETFDEVVEGWIGYPVTKTSVLHRPSLYLRERCRLTNIFCELHDLLMSDEDRHHSLSAYVDDVRLMSVKLEQWHQHLPFELQYVWPMSIAVWELHASYLAFHMTIWVVARNRCQQRLDSKLDSLEERDKVSQTARDCLSKAIPLAHQSAQILSDFRTRYGLKITPPFLLQLQAVTASILVLDPELTDPTLISSTHATELKGSIRDSHTAFDEVFRCLLGTGVEVMIARGIARMVYHTALSQKIVLSQSTRTMLQIMSDTAWRPSDLTLLNSKYPDFTTTRGHEDGGRMTELLSKWEKLEI